MDRKIKKEKVRMRFLYRDQHRKKEKKQKTERGRKEERDIFF